MGGYNIQKAVLLEGGGGNGKSVYLDTVTAMLGADNVSSVSWQELGEDKYAKAQLYGKMANIHTDLSKSAITDTSAFKALTGGDKIWSDVKHSIKGINFYNRAKLVYACNQIPRSKDITDAFFDRLILINFPFKIRGTKDEDKNLKKKLIEELPGIFNWAIVGLNRLLETESFSTSKTTDDFKSIYQKKSDTVVAFFRELVRRGEKEDKETKEDVYQFYVAYCKEHLNIEPVNKQVFGAAFGKQAGWVGSGQRYVFVEKGEDSIRLSCWTNITIKDLPGKQDTIPWTGEGIVSEKSTPKKPSNTTHTIPKPPFSPTEILDSPDNPIFDKGKDIKKEISDKNRRKGIVCVDKTSQKDRVTALLGMIQSREKTFNGTVVYKSELADDYQLKKWTMAQLDEDIQTLLRDGIIYDPNNNERYKTV
jgi:P4 family phage/plasmid primase-like protien